MLFLLIAALTVQPDPSTRAQAAANGQTRAVASERRIVGGSISNADYPVEALRVGAAGTTVAEIDIAADGRVTACRIGQSAGHAALDTVTCSILTSRFRFERASTASSRSLRVAWQLPESPESEQAPFAPSRVIVQTSYAAAGPAFCQRSVEGRPPGALGNMVCAPNANAPGPPSRFTSRMTTVQEFVPDGQSLPRSPLLSSRFKEQYRLRLEVDQQGVVTRCEQTAAPDQILTNRAFARSRCNDLTAGGRAIFERSNSLPVRTGEFMDGIQFERN
jgi:TonB family protein